MDLRNQIMNLMNKMLMNNTMNQQNNNINKSNFNFQKNNNSNSQLISGDSINVNFKGLYEEKPIMINCKKNDLISTVIERYRNLSNIHDKSYKFIFNNKELDENLTVEESGIVNNSNIIFQNKFVFFSGVI